MMRSKPLPRILLLLVLLGISLWLASCTPYLTRVDYDPAAGLSGLKTYAWVPVETTIVGSSFVKAWELGAANYYKWKDKGLTLLNVHESWNVYKPASLPESSQASLPSRTRASASRAVAFAAEPSAAASSRATPIQTGSRRHPAGAKGGMR